MIETLMITAALSIVACGSNQTPTRTALSQGQAGQLSAVADTVGFFLAESNAFDLPFENNPHAARLRFHIYSSNSGFFDLVPGVSSMMPLAGDFDGDGFDSVGLYDTERADFLLKNVNSDGLPDSVFQFGPKGAKPVAGDFDGDGVDTVAVYVPSTGEFQFPDGSSFLFGQTGGTPFAGDFDGDGFDTVGVMNPWNGTFYLKNELAAGEPDVVLTLGFLAWQPMVGDFDGDGVDTIGRFNASTGRVRYRTANDPHAPIKTFLMDSDTNYFRTPLMGRWDCEGHVENVGYGWPEGDPADFGFDQERLAAAYDFAREAPELEFLRSLLVLRHGHLLAEEYFHGNSGHWAHNLRSVTKSVSSILLGIAIADGAVGSVDDLVSDYYPEYFAEPPRDRAPGRETMTVEHLLTMSAGFFAPYQLNYFPWWASGDLTGFILTRPLNFTPGTQFTYTDGISHVIGNLVERTSGELLPLFAIDRLFVPLGIQPVRWDRYQGQFLGYTSIFLKPRDMARLGYLYLRDGEIDGQQIVPPEWVEASTRPQPFVSTYGYQWWLDVFGGYRCFYAWGWGGQLVFNFPELDLVVVTTTKSDYIADGSVSAFIKTELLERVLAAVR